MRLRAYLDREKLSTGDFAELVGVSSINVHRYALEPDRAEFRIPRPAIMAAIVKATDGAVTANDFYLLEPGDAEANARARARQRVKRRIARSAAARKSAANRRRCRLLRISDRVQAP